MGLIIARAQPSRDRKGAIPRVLLSSPFVVALPGGRGSVLTRPALIARPRAATATACVPGRLRSLSTKWFQRRDDRAQSATPDLPRWHVPPRAPPAGFQ